MLNRSDACRTSIGQRKIGRDHKLLLSDIQPPIRNMIQTYQRTNLHDKAGQNLYVWTTKTQKNQTRRLPSIRTLSPPNQTSYSFMKTMPIKEKNKKNTTASSLPPMNPLSTVHCSKESHAQTSRPFIKDSGSLDEILFNEDGPRIEYPDRKRLKTIRPIEITKNTPEIIDLGECHRRKITDKESDITSHRKANQSSRLSRQSQSSRKVSESGRQETIRMMDDEDLQDEEEDFSQFSLGVEFEPPPEERKITVNPEMIKMLQISKQLASESSGRKKSGRLRSSRSGCNNLRL